MRRPFRYTPRVTLGVLLLLSSLGTARAQDSGPLRSSPEKPTSTRQMSYFGWHEPMG